MALRVTSQEVKDILDTTITDFYPFIVAANSIVTDELETPVVLTDTTRLKEIERWLAAHLFRVSKEPAIMSEKTGASQVNYYGVSGLGLDATSQGQQVKILDSSGTLVNLGRRKARMDTVQAVDVT